MCFSLPALPVSNKARIGLVISILLALTSVGTPVHAAATDGSTGPSESDNTDSQHVYDPALFQSIEWRNIGPFRGGRSTAVAGVIQDPLTYYFGGVGGGIYKTTDAGLHWQNVSDGQLETGSVGALAVAPSDPNVVWAGMGESCARGVMTTHGDGVYRSTDGGVTWTHLGLEETQVISEIEVHPRDPDTAWIAAQGHLWGPNEERGVYKTTDGGATWTKVLFVDEHTGAADLSLDPNNPRVLYAAMWQHGRTPWKITSGGRDDEATEADEATSGIYKTSDGGTSWTELTEGLPAEMGKIGVSVSGADSSRVYAIVESNILVGDEETSEKDESDEESSKKSGGLYRSDDAGKSWKLINADRLLWTRSWYYMHVFAHPTDHDMVWVLNAPALLSVDGGKSFRRVPTPHGDNHDLWIHPTTPRYMVEANDGGANVSTNGGATWSSQANQATAQFYRVATDDQFPYQIYGGQQDNSAITIQSRSFDVGITEKNWWDVAGCESSDPAFDRADPRYVYGGCYQGILDEWDRETRQSRDIMVRPEMNLSKTPREMTYRFNWNAPVLVSRHDSGVIYYAGNVVFRSANRGQGWSEISPDLTRDQEDRQVDGGGPFTKEGAGGEVYGTILALAESPHDAGVLWTGSDDGMVHVTRDGGGQWHDVTPADATEAMINTVELSPHRSGSAYLAVTRYKWDDLSPMIFRTHDFGTTWTRLDAGLPEETIVRVVREDPAREGLLYAGTESGVFVSWDDGERWQKLELGLPTVPVTDLEVKDADLVAATHGRSFWILDDLTPLRELTDEVATEELRLLQPRPAYLVAGAPSWRETPPSVGKNPPSGLVVRYLVKEDEDEDENEDSQADGDLEAIETAHHDDSTEEAADDGSSETEPLLIEIFDAEGVLVRRAASDDEKKEGGTAPPTLEPGLQSWTWDLTWHAPAALEQKGVVTFVSTSGPLVGPGNYRVRLTRGATVRETEAEVRLDPRSDYQPKDYTARRDFLLRIRGHIHDLYDTANRLAAAKSQVKGWLERVESSDLGEESEQAIQDAAQQLTDRIDEIDGQLVQRKTTGFQDVINFSNRLDSDFGTVMGSAAGFSPIVNDGAREILAELEARWSELRAEAEELLASGVDAFERVLADQGVGRIMVPSPKPLIPED
ncbi:MAG: glycosyl hydrolase [Thermoanaerobaculia bacterium]|nr:glycosyl hydrolase [Thermoanaerobaculia bacterium]